MHSRSDNTESVPTRQHGLPKKQGLYDPFFEHDACGVGFVVDMKGRKSHQIVKQAIQVLENLDHRGAAGSEVNTGWISVRSPVGTGHIRTKAELEPGAT